MLIAAIEQSVESASSQIDWNYVKAMNDIAWLWYSNIVLLVPLTIIFFYKLYNPIDWELVLHKKGYKKSNLDKLITILASYPIFYYVTDSILLIATGRWMLPCGSSFFVHHVVAMVAMPFVVCVPYWSWFWLGPGFFHSYLNAFPDAQWLNYIYLLIIICYQCGIHTTPLSKLRQYRFMKWGIVCIMLSVVPIWWNDCKNTLPCPIE